MGKISDAVNRFRHFVSEVKVELGKSAWPTRSELMESTVVIVISVLVLGGIVGASDWILKLMVKILIR